MTESAHPLQPDQGTYYQLATDGVVIPLDPVTREPLRQGVIPESLASDPELSAGFSFLLTNAERIKFQLLLTSHGDRAALWRSRVDLQSAAEELARGDGVLFLEGVGTIAQIDAWRTRFNEYAGLDEAAAHEARTTLHDSPGSSSYRTEMLYQVTSSGVTVELPDFRRDGERPYEQALARWLGRITEAAQAIETAEAAELPELPALYDAFSKLEVGFVAYRDWAMLGRLGALLQSHGSPSGVVSAALLAGRVHENIGGHLESFGVAVEYQGREQTGAPTTTLMVAAAGRLALTGDEREQYVALAISPPSL